MLTSHFPRIRSNCVNECAELGFIFNIVTLCLCPAGLQRTMYTSKTKLYQENNNNNNHTYNNKITTFQNNNCTVHKLPENCTAFSRDRKQLCLFWSKWMFMSWNIKFHTYLYFPSDCLHWRKLDIQCAFSCNVQILKSYKTVFLFHRPANALSHKSN